MQGFRLDGLGDNVRINSIGKLFRGLERRGWSVNINFWPRQERRSLTVSNAPLLALRRVLNPTEMNGIAGYPKRFTVGNASGWRADKAGAYPAHRKLRLDPGQNCFVFSTEDDIKVFLPQFELARVLFFRDGYLSRSAMMHGLLDSEFEVLEEHETAQINVHKHSGYGVTHFEDPDNRRVLSWILLDADARRSFESIAQHELMEGVESGGYRLWDFSFAPPPLQGARFDVRGHLDKESRSYFVFEVVGLRKVPASIPTDIGMYHPDYEQKVRSNGQSGALKAEGVNQIDVQDGFEAALSDSRQRLDTDKTTTSFNKAFVVHRSAGKERVGSGAKMNSEEPTEASRDVSVEDSSTTGNLPGADWNSFDDQTDDAHLYLGRFKAFLDMVNLLEVHHGITVVRRDLRKLPELPRCKKHLLSTDGSHRHLAVIELNYQGCSGQVKLATVL
ncbi:transcriptional antiterminator [Ferrimonas sediminicola]|uniref:Transcriptional antiterminator n=1 Tax=Ferrimonas sediminicola TaxID=2569538 RepID=A0A4U1B8S6_9GAMM|nr:Tn7-like element transposition protein TnsE [Ferrimonas sediminicola]TKB47017.1 transcriptional antiterminator [Ferrimonas sediminicola]